MPVSDADKVILNIIRSGDVEAMRATVQGDPAIKNRRVGGFTCLQVTATSDGLEPQRCEEMLRMLVAEGCDVNHYNELMRSTALSSALVQKNLTAAICLLELGADPNEGRLLFTSIGRDKPDSLSFVKLLVQHGVEINRSFEMAGTGLWMTALDFARVHGCEDVAAYLESLGAVSATDAKNVPELTTDEFLEAASTHFGSVFDFHLTEIVPSGADVKIHVATSIETDGCRTLFTSGLRHFGSCRVGQQLRRVPIELFIQLPVDWPMGNEALQQPEFMWPYVWMKNISGQFAAEQLTIEGPFAVWSAGGEGESIAAHLPHTAFLLLAEKDVERPDGDMYFMRMFPDRLRGKAGKYSAEWKADRGVDLDIDLTTRSV